VLDQPAAFSLRWLSYLDPDRAWRTAQQCRPSAAKWAGPSFEVWMAWLLFVVCLWQFPIITAADKEWCDGSQLPASYCGGLCSIPGQSMWDLWWTRWQWDRVSSFTCVFPVSIIPHVPHLVCLIITGSVVDRVGSVGLGTCYGLDGPLPLLYASERSSVEVKYTRTRINCHILFVIYADFPLVSIWTSDFTAMTVALLWSAVQWRADCLQIKHLNPNPANVEKMVSS
jgi:hypothetical protein